MTGTINANETLNGGVEAIPTLSGTLSGNTTSSYNSLSDKPIINGTTLEGGVDRSLVEDVKVNGVSVVTDHIAEIENSAENVPYDNSDSGLEADNVQDAIDEEVDALGDEVTLREELESATKVYGTPKNLPQPIATFTDGASLPMPSLKTTIVPIQDLHGYDGPWVGGSGKNKLPMTVDGIKNANLPSSSWSGKARLLNGVTFTILTDESENVIGIKAHGQATETTSLYISKTLSLPNGSYTLNGCPSGGGLQAYGVFADYSSGGNIPSYGEDATLPINNVTLDIRIRIASGYNCNNLVFTPMIRLSSVTDSTFAPYSNIRPISGWSAVNVSRTGKNFYNPSFTREWGYYDDNGVLQTSSTTGHTQLTPINSNTEYYFSIHARSNGGGKFAVYFWDANRNWISRASKDYSSNFDDNNITFTTPNNCRFISFQVPIGTSVTSLEFDDSLTMICLNSLGTDFAPYNGHTYTIPFTDSQGNPIEVFGGELDVVNGVLTVDRVMFALNGSENWATDIVGDNKRRFTCTSLIDLGATTTTTFDAISNIYVNTKRASYTDLSEVFILRYLSQYNQNRIDIMTEAYQDVASFKAFLNSTNMQIVYELATPQTIQLTPTAVKSLLGSNNVWGDCGQIKDLKYVRNLNITINDLISRVEALEG